MSSVHPRATTGPAEFEASFSDQTTFIFDRLVSEAAAMFCLGFEVSWLVFLGLSGMSYARMGVKLQCMHSVFATRPEK